MAITPRRCEAVRDRGPEATGVSAGDIASEIVDDLMRHNSLFPAPPAVSAVTGNRMCYSQNTRTLVWFPSLPSTSTVRSSS